ncbi:hypothetical protein GCM10020254_16080 [Streptomyces goshikiensis]
MIAACPYAWTWNVLGWPGINIPAGFTPDGLPLGAQLLGPGHSEPLLLSLAAQVEAEEAWGRHWPAGGGGRGGGPEGFSSGGTGQCWGLPASLTVLPVRSGPSRALPSVASLRDGLRPPLTARPAPECQRLSGTPKERSGGTMTTQLC